MIPDRHPPTPQVAVIVVGVNPNDGAAPIPVPDVGAEVTVKPTGKVNVITDPALRALEEKNSKACVTPVSLDAIRLIVSLAFKYGAAMTVFSKKPIKRTKKRTKNIKVKRDVFFMFNIINYPLFYQKTKDPSIRDESFNLFLDNRFNVAQKAIKP